MYVARFTNDPENDIQRGWSGWMEQGYATLVAAAEIVFGSEAPDTETAAAEMLENEGHNFRFDERLSCWRHVHHDGLSCFALEAKNLDAAVKEARERKLEWVGFGQRTLGSVKVAQRVEENLWIFECDDVAAEM